MYNLFPYHFTGQTKDKSQLYIHISWADVYGPIRERFPITSHYFTFSLFPRFPKYIMGINTALFHPAIYSLTRSKEKYLSASLCPSLRAKCQWSPSEVPVSEVLPSQSLPALLPPPPSPAPRASAYSSRTFPPQDVLPPRFHTPALFRAIELFKFQQS